MAVYTQHQQFEDEQVDLLKVCKTLRDGRKSILIITVIFSCLGILHYLSDSTEYESQSVLLLEIQEGEQGRMINELGFSISSISNEEIPPGLYQEIVYNVEFQRELLYEDLELSDASNTNIFDYFSLLYSSSATREAYDIIYRSIPNLEALQTDLEDKYLQLSEEETKFIYILRQRIKLEISDGLIIVKTKLPDPVAAASLNTIIVEKLSDYVTQYQIERAQKRLKFAELQYREAKERYSKTQYELARFSDKNKLLTTALARTQLEELQYSQELHFDIYNHTSHELEEAKLRVQERKPIFFVLQRSSVSDSPVGHSGLVLTVATLLGLIVGVGWVVISEKIVSSSESHK